MVRGRAPVGGNELMTSIIRSPQDLAAMVQEYGFLPLLRNRIPGFSVEEHTPPELWFADGVDGPWEWKGPVIRSTRCAYGKFFEGRAGFISAEWFLDFANYRRNGYDFDTRCDEGLVRRQDREVYDILAAHTPLLSKEWRRLSGVKNRGGFDAIVSRLQMLGYVITIDFEYAKDRSGKPYGWGLARYATPEQYWGGAFSNRVYKDMPEDSGARIADHLKRLWPEASGTALERIIGSRL